MVKDQRSGCVWPANRQLVNLNLNLNLLWVEMEFHEYGIEALEVLRMWWRQISLILVLSQASYPTRPTIAYI